MYKMDWENIFKETLGYFLDYLRIDTTNPPGNEIKGALFFKDIFEKENISSVLYETAPGRGNIFAKIEGESSEKPLILLNHIDIVPVDREKWDVEPFGGVIKDGYAYGRGTQDMKNMAVIQLMVMLLIKRSGIKPGRDVYFAATADEEKESNFGIIKLLETAPELQNPGFVITEGGGGTQGVFAEKNKVVWGIGVGEKSPLFLHLEVHGTAGHGSQPDAANPNEILIKAVNNVLHREEEERWHPLVLEMMNKIGNLPDNKFINALTKNTISVTSVRGGIGDPPKVNVIPSTCSATLDCRLMPGVNPDDFLDKMSNLLNDDRITVTPAKMPGGSIISPRNTELYRVIEETAKEKIPASVIVPIIVPYATDSRYLRQKGFVCYGFTPVISTLEDLSLMHGDNERIGIEAFTSGVELLYDIVVRFCKKVSL